jgi:hypothetical protein
MRKRNINYSQYNLSDTEKFTIMVKKFPNLFESEKIFAQKIFVSHSSVNHWINHKTKKIKATAKSEICNVFGLLFSVWEDDFAIAEDFEKELLNYKKIRNTKDMIEKHIMKSTDTKQPIFLFEKASEYKENKKIKEALKLIEEIESCNSSFKYTHHNQISHLKAILLSDDTIQDWDGAIHILRNLYFSAKYHLEEPEIITLIASNYKRKALYSPITKKLREQKEVDVDLIASALTLYFEAYELKDSQDKYYDALNYSYLYNISNIIESKKINRDRIKLLYNDFSKRWRVDEKSWWEVVSRAEFQMLMGNLNIAISEINYFVETYSVTPSQIYATLRQLKLYIHFTHEKNAIEFYQYLRDFYEFIQKSKKSNNETL